MPEGLFSTVGRFAFFAFRVPEARKETSCGPKPYPRPRANYYCLGLLTYRTICPGPRRFRISSTKHEGLETRFDIIADCKPGEKVRWPGPMCPLSSFPRTKQAAQILPRKGNLLSGPLDGTPRGPACRCISLPRMPFRRSTKVRGNDRHNSAAFKDLISCMNYDWAAPRTNTHHLPRIDDLTLA
ncbi:uncharacterized protein PV07_07708 [Cladophialophora immunda]|uniref:Uncharacterized protein n=1 Tax=Cladophialophora immunda TaxID=569365 RepID=A0A0D2CAG7_9EURO|nr:uncharacterized protein PV07_07708 [Cladophialophora immunda]KIW28018.1 hypothetical protein PV07_07708 [Cladophialophora immunda]